MRQSEAAFQAAVVEYAGLNGWLCFHPPDNRPITTKTGRRYVQAIQAGFPDLTLVRGPRLVFAELKADKGRVAQAQQHWLDALGVVAEAVRQAVSAPVGHADTVGEALDAVPSMEVFVWRPNDWPQIEEVLSR